MTNGHHALWLVIIPTLESRKEDGDDNVDEPADYFDTEWHELQDNANLTEERFRAFRQDKHFKKAFKKFKTKFAK